MGLRLIATGSVGTVCVYPVCSVDDLVSGVHMFPLDQVLGEEFIQGGIGDYAEDLGGDGARESRSEHHYEGSACDSYTNGRFGAGIVAVVLERHFFRHAAGLQLVIRSAPAVSDPGIL